MSLRRLRVVADTNVFIDAMFNDDKSCQSLLKYKHDGDIVFCMNEETYKELYLIFARMTEKVKLTRDLDRLFPKFGNTLYQVEWIDHNTKVDYCEDKSDNKFIECCIDGKIEYLITSDMHLREVQKDVEDIKNKYGLDLKIMSAYQFSRELLKIKINS